MKGGWDTALDAQNDLRASFHTVEGARYMRNFTQALARDGKMFDADTLEPLPGDPQNANTAVQAAVATVEHGLPMWVSEGVVELVEYAAEGFRPEPIMPDDLFTPQAFAYLERPLLLPDVHERDIPYRALSWSVVTYDNNPGKQGVQIAIWSHKDDDDPDFDRRAWELIGSSALSLMHSGDIPFGDERYLREPSYQALARQLQVMWRLAKQEVVVPGMERVSRPVWRRKSNWRAIKEVQVLRLRRAKHAKYEGEEREVEWSHRWMVGGHWRNQWYPSMNRHFQIWINPHIKGPDDAPFIEKKRAIEFTR